MHNVISLFNQLAESMYSVNSEPTQIQRAGLSRKIQGVSEGVIKPEQFECYIRQGMKGYNIGIDCIQVKSLFMEN